MGKARSLYQDWQKDDKVAEEFCKLTGYDYYDAAPFVLEGGSIHSDGQGTVIATEACLLSKGRNPELTKEQIEAKLREYLGAKKIIWLPNGIYQDETNEHVDNVCAFLRPGEVVLAWTDDKNDPQYAAEHPEAHAAKEELYENLMAGRSSALDEKLAALGQTQEDYLPSEIEKFKDATGYEEFLDFDPAEVKAALDDPEKSHADEMLSAAEKVASEKMTVLVVEPMKEPYVKEIDPGLHALQAEVGGDIAASYPFDDPVGLVLNDEGKLIGLDLNRSLRDEHGEIYDIVAGTFLVVGLGPESFASLPPDMIQKYTEQFKRPELFASINGQIVSVPVEPENPLRTAEMTLEDDYGMIDGIINNGRRGEELEKAQTEARRTTPEKKPSIRERLEDAKRECAERKSPDKPAPQKKPPELGDL